MSYSNKLPNGITFKPTVPEVLARIEIDPAASVKSLHDKDVEVTLPSWAREEFGFAAKSVPFSKLLKFIECEGAPISFDRDMTLRYGAWTEEQVRAGKIYDHRLHVDLPPQEKGDDQDHEVAFDTGYVMGLVARDIDDEDPESAAYLRRLASDYFTPSEEDFQPSEEQIASMLSDLEDMLSADRSESEAEEERPMPRYFVHFE